MLSKAKHPFSPSFFRRQGPGDGFFGLRPQNDALAGAVRVMGRTKSEGGPFTLENQRGTTSDGRLIAAPTKPPQRWRRGRCPHRPDGMVCALPPPQSPAATAPPSRGRQRILRLRLRMTGNIWACLGSRAHEPRYSVERDDPGAPNHAAIGAHLCVRPFLPRVMLSGSEASVFPVLFPPSGAGRRILRPAASE